MTGTDTGVGKTWVTSRLAAFWTAAGHRVAALKAIESGCRPTPADPLFAEDDDLLFNAAGAWQPERCRIKFAAAVAPGVAADDLGQPIDFGLIASQVANLTRHADIILVEGAGGWLVPLGHPSPIHTTGSGGPVWPETGRTIADLAEMLGLPVVVVGRATLGTINHTALTVRAVRASGVVLAAVALSLRPEDDRELASRNRDEIERMTGAPVVLVGQEIGELVAVL